MVTAIMQKTLILLKPDCMEKKHAGAVLDRLEKAGFEIIGCKMLRLTPTVLRTHYATWPTNRFTPRLRHL